MITVLSTSCTHVASSHGDSSMIERPVSFHSSKDGVELHGTFSSNGACKAPVLMLTGSGKADRDETVRAAITHSRKQEKLFRQISDALVRAGFCTLRYDKRGVLDETGKVDAEIWKTADREHLIADAVEGARVLLQMTNCNPKQLLVLGHSEGTILSVETALELGGEVKGLLLLGLQSRSMKEMLHYQIVESRSPQKSGVGETDSPEEEYRKALDMIQTSTDILAPDGKPMNWYRQYLQAPANSLRAEGVSGKFAVFQGEADPQTPVDEVDQFKRHRPDLIIHRYPNLGHGFSPDLEGQPTLGPIEAHVLDDLVKQAIEFSQK